MSKLKITLAKSLIGRLEKQQKTALALGLTKIGDETVQEDSAVTNGKINVIRHLVKVEKVD
ncbi:MAG: 50S ribosomal protein L30 [Oscillospiraceae bacterium]|nr:50S ribosomal protein L30 [Oscillospiraceae bacterium]